MIDKACKVTCPLTTIVLLLSAAVVPMMTVVRDVPVVGSGDVSVDAGCSCDPVEGSTLPVEGSLVLNSENK